MFFLECEGVFVIKSIRIFNKNGRLWYLVLVWGVWIFMIYCKGIDCDSYLRLVVWFYVKENVNVLRKVLKV